MAGFQILRLTRLLQQSKNRIAVGEVSELSIQLCGPSGGGHILPYNQWDTVTAGPVTRHVPRAACRVYHADTFIKGMS